VNQKQTEQLSFPISEKQSFAPM